MPALFGNVAIQMMESLYNTFDNIINYILENLPEEVKTIEEALNFFQKEMENPENIHKHREEANKETQYIKNGPDRVNEYIEEVTVDQLRRGLRWNPESQLPLGEYIHVRGFNWTSDGQAAVVEGFLELANNIAKLCQMAAKNDISIRYFEYTDDQALKKSGGEAWLKPLNSKEITSIVKIYQPIVMLLTRTNRESLVFLSKHIEDHPAVLFSADSNFDFGLPPVTDGMIITAPHHGSSSNNRLAVELAKLNTYQFLWIRSDGRLSSISKSQGANWSRPASWYTALADVHACTHCNDATVIQNVHAKVISGRWKLYSATKKCRCT